MAISIKSIAKPKAIKPPKLFLYGTEKIGKSSFAAQAPDPVFIFTEDGVSADVQPPTFTYDEEKGRYVCNSVDEFRGAVQSLIVEDHDRKTLVIDSITFLEKLVWKDLCEKYGQESITSNAKGSPFAWSRGYELAIENYWNAFLRAFDVLRDQKNMAIILIAHTKQRIVSPPDSEDYFQYCPDVQSSSEKLPSRSLMDLLARWADAILYVYEKQVVLPVGSDDKGRKKGEFVGHRVIATTRTASYLAGNRFELSPEIPFKKGEAWAAFAAEIQAYADRAKQREVKLSPAASEATPAQEETEAAPKKSKKAA